MSSNLVVDASIKETANLGIMSRMIDPLNCEENEDAVIEFAPNPAYCEYHRLGDQSGLFAEHQYNASTREHACSAVTGANFAASGAGFAFTHDLTYASRFAD